MIATADGEELVDIIGDLYGISVNILLDTLSIPYNFIDKETSDRLMEKGIARTTCNVNVKLGNGEYINISHFFNVKLTINNNNSLLINLHVLNSLPTNIIIGRSDILKYNLLSYVTMNNLTECSGLAMLTLLAGEEALETQFQEAFPILEEERKDDSFTPKAGGRNTALPETVEEEMIRILRHDPKYDDVFQDNPGELPADVRPMDLRLKEGISGFPKSMRLPTRIQCAEHEAEINKQLDKLLILGIIEPCNADFYSQVLLTKKADGSLRFCVDYRALNGITDGLAWPLPNIEHTLNKLEGSQYFIVMDLTSGYHQMALTEEASYLTSFRTSRGIFKFNRVPFGLKGAPSFFQKAMQIEILGDLLNDCCQCYIDDVIIMGKTKEELLHNARRVLDRFKQRNIKIKPKKCQWGLTEVAYLGHVATGQGVRMSDERKEVLRAIAKPTNLTQLRSFLGLANYFSRFVKFGDEKTILNRMSEGLKSKQARLRWTPEADAAFIQLKDKILAADLLYFLKPEGDLTLYCDASDYCCGGVLTQHQLTTNKTIQEVPIYFFSHSFNKTETRWTTTEKEMFAIVFGVRKLHPYIAARKVLVRSDHKALCFNDRVSASPKVERWKMAIAEYDLTFMHVAGVDNVVADGLSRCIFDEHDMEQQNESYDALLMAITDSDHTVSDQRKTAIESVHNDITGHWGVNKTVDLLQSRGTAWRGMRRDIAFVLRRCECTRLKPQKAVHPGLRYQLNSERPGEVLAIDTKTVSQEPDSLGYSYILHIVDCFSRYLVSYPLTRLDGMGTYRILEDHFDREGEPLDLICDSGTQFANKEIKQLCTARNIDLLTTTPYSHEENGIAERVIRTISEQLDIQRHLHPDKPWSSLLQRTVRAYNTVTHLEIGCSPANLMKGIFNRVSASDEVVSRQDQKSYFDIAKKKIDESNQRVPAQQTPVPLQPGHYILIAVDRTGKKTSTLLRNEGPYKVNQVIDDTVYYQHPNFQRELRIHCSQVSRYYPKEGEIPEQSYLDSLGTGKYFVEAILDHYPKQARVRAANLQLHVKYANFEAEWTAFNPDLAKTVAFVKYAQTQPALSTLVRARLEES